MNFTAALLTLRISVLEPWESPPWKGGPWPPGLLSGGRREGIRQYGALGEAYKGRSENWLHPDSHASSQPPKALSPESVAPTVLGDWMKA